MCALFPKYRGKSQRSLGRDFPFRISDPNPDSRFSTPKYASQNTNAKMVHFHTSISDIKPKIKPTLNICTNVARFTAGFAVLVLCAKTRSNLPKYLTPRKYESITAVCLNKTFYGSGMIFCTAFLVLALIVAQICHFAPIATRPITSGLSAPQPRRFSQSDLNSRHVRNK